MAGRPWPSWLLVGPTGSGKTPLGDELERSGFLGRRCVHFDFGANLRRIAAAPEPRRALIVEIHVTPSMTAAEAYQALVERLAP